MTTPPVSLPGEFHGQRSLVGYSVQCPKESDMTERLTLTSTFRPAIWKDTQGETCEGPDDISF